MATFTNRISWHRYMGDSKEYPCCDGRGWKHEVVPGTEDDYIPDFKEAYCDCECGELKRKLEQETTSSQPSS